MLFHPKNSRNTEAVSSTVAISDPSTFALDACGEGHEENEGASQLVELRLLMTGDRTVQMYFDTS